MMNRLICAALAAYALAGCATPASTVSWWTLRESNFRDLRPGVTTKDEVLKRMGTPYATMTFARLQEEVWDYRYVDLATMMRAAVHFDAKGVFKSYSAERDPAFYSAFGS